MKKYPIGMIVVGLLAMGAPNAASQTATPTVTDLAKGKISGPFSLEVKDTSDVVMHRAVYDAAGVGNTWHSHPGSVNVAVKTGSITVHTTGGSGCTSKTYKAGEAFSEPAGVTHVHEGSQDVEILVTYVGVPVGAPVSKDEATPTGANCPAKLTTGIARTELARSTITGPISASATGDSETLMQVVTVPPGADFRGWYSSPGALFAATKAGSLTIYRGNATSCTSTSGAPGKGSFVAANEVIFVRNEGSVPTEVYATRLGLPVGAAPRVDAKNPGGANCPDVAGPQPNVVDLARGKITGPFSVEAQNLDVVTHRAVYDAAGVGNTWHSHPGSVNVVVKTGSMTIHTSGATGCTSRTYKAGEAFSEPAGVTHVHEGSQDLEILVTYVGVPVGAAVAKDEAAPPGATCPAKLATGIARSEVARSTVQGLVKAAATGDSDLLVQSVAVPARAALRGWFSTPAGIVATVKSGSLTVYRGNATTCTSQTYSPGQGLFAPANEPLFVRNEGSVPAEVISTRLGLPVGGPARVDATKPGGANCPDVAAAPRPVSTGQLPRTGGLGGALTLIAGIVIAFGGLALAFGDRRAVVRR